MLVVGSRKILRMLATLISMVLILTASCNGEEIPTNSTIKDGQPPKVWKQLGDHATPLKDGILELDYAIGGADFYANFVKKRTPLIFRGITKNWNAVKHWHDEEYLKEKYGHVLMDVEMGKVYNNELYPRKTMNMTEFLGMYKEKTIYLDSPFPQSEMMNDLEVPFFMQCPELSKNFTSAHLLFSSGNTSSCFHQDGYENLLTMISATKDVVLVNYTYTEEVYADDIDTFPGLSPISPESVDLDKWPRFKDVPFHKVTLHPGDMIYVPKNWWHHVRSHGSPNIGVSIWFNVFMNTTMPGDNEELLGMRDVIKLEKLFANVVKEAPETIECKSQNMPISAFLSFEQTWNMPKEKDVSQKKIKLKSGYEMPMFGLGTAGLFNKTESLVQAALKEGYRMIDSAQAYNESGVGIAIESSGINRHEIFIVSKVHPKNLGYETTIQSVHESLFNLKTDYIDLMLIHSKDCDEGPDALLVCVEGEPKGDWVETWKALEFLVKKGKIRSIGVSNFEADDLKSLQKFAEIELSVVQNWFDPFYTDDDIRKWCKDNGVAYMGYSTLGESWVREGLGYNPVLQDEELKRIARRFDADVPRVALRWAIGNDVIVIPRSTNPVHIATNLQINVIEFEQADIEYINSLNGTLNPDFSSPEDPPQETKTSQDQLSKKEQSQKTKEFVYSNVLYEEVLPDRPTIFLSSDDFWIYAFDAETGQIKWKTETADETGSTCAFSLTEEIVYCGADDSYIRALYTRDGTIAWKFKTGASVTSSSHVTKDGTLVIGSHDKFLYALHPNGTLRWKFKCSDAIWSSPTSNQNGDLIFISSYAEFGRNIYAIELKTGKEVWTFQGEGGFISSPRVSPDESIVVLCSSYGTVYALDLWTGELVWKKEFEVSVDASATFARKNRVFVATYGGEVAAIDSRTGNVIWSKQVSVNVTSSPTLGPDGQLYIGGGDGEMIALKQENGDRIWTKKIGSWIFVSSPRLSKSGLLYIGTADKPGPLYALNSENGDIVWKTDTNGPIVGTPLITNRFAATYY